jgi:curli biogenesis system outer membrane secretion channel CsgG
VGRCSKVAALLLAVTPSAIAGAQSKSRVAIFALDDRVAATRNMDIGDRVADALVANLTASHAFVVVDRTDLKRLIAEQNYKFDARFDPQTAVKIGKLADANLIVVGHIDAFNANVKNSVTHAVFGFARTTSTGIVDLGVTVQVIDVATGQIVAAPKAQVEQRAELAKGTNVSLPKVGPLSSENATANTDKGLAKLVDTCIDQVTAQLAAQFPVSAPPPIAAPISAKVAGIYEGDVLIDKGSDAGVQIGMTFDISRSVNTGLKDPDTGKPLILLKKVCNLTITEVQQTLAGGKCAGGSVPQAGDSAAGTPNP